MVFDGGIPLELFHGIPIANLWSFSVATQAYLLSMWFTQWSKALAQHGTRFKFFKFKGKTDEEPANQPVSAGCI